MSKILITGLPKSGKSTLLKSIADTFSRKDKAGFVTKEIKVGKSRVGFEIETADGKTKSLAHINNLKSKIRVGKYGVNVAPLESLSDHLMRQKRLRNKLLYIDEIGEMQLHSNKFQDLVEYYLESSDTVIMTASLVFDSEFITRLRVRPDVTLVEISELNRDVQRNFILRLLQDALD